MISVDILGWYGHNKYLGIDIGRILSSIFFIGILCVANTKSSFGFWRRFPLWDFPFQVEGWGWLETFGVRSFLRSAAKNVFFCCRLWMLLFANFYHLPPIGQRFFTTERGRVTNPRSACKDGPRLLPQLTKAWSPLVEEDEQPYRPHHKAYQSMKLVV